MRHTRRENANRYKSNDSAILHIDTTRPDIIARITTVPERKSTGCLTEAMVIWYGIIKKEDVADVLPDTSPGNNIPSGTCCANKV